MKMGSDLLALIEGLESGRVWAWDMAPGPPQSPPGGPESGGLRIPEALRNRGIHGAGSFIECSLPALKGHATPVLAPEGQLS